MSLHAIRNHFQSIRKPAAGALFFAVLLAVIISAAGADPLTMSRMEGSGFTVYFARNPEGEKEKSEVLHVLGSQTAYCMNSNKPFQKGNAVAIDKSAAGWDDAHARKAALAWYYVNEVSSVSLSKMEKEQIIQVIIWNIFKDKVTEHVWTLDPPKDTFINITEAFETWYTANSSRYSYTASFYANEDDPADSQAVAVFSVEELAGKIHVKKSSSDSSISSGNAGYSLAGAVYQVYTDSGCTQAAKTTGGANASMTTDSSGKSGSVELPAGTYYVKETKAPTGFAVNTGVTKVTVGGGGAEQEISVQNTPFYDAGGLVIRKIDAETGESLPAAGGDLAGAEFTVRFYAGSYTKDNLPSRADRTWVIRSVKGTSGGKNVYEASLSDACKVSGDAFYKSGSKVVLPLGTVTVQETKEPKGYFRSETWKDGTGKTVSGIYLKSIKASANASGGAALDGGNLISSVEQPVPEIGTELTDAAGSHYLSAEEGTVVLTDTVRISHFNQYVGQKVTFTGTLKDQDGTTAAQGRTTVTITADMSSVAVPVSFDPSRYAGKMLYCDEKAEDSSGKLIAAHEGANDEKQMVYVPEIRTSLLDQGTGTKTVSLHGEEDAEEAEEANDAEEEEAADGSEDAENSGIKKITLTDTVTYRNLQPGSQKVMKAALCDAGTGEPVKDADGEPVTASQAFTVSADGAGTVEVTFAFTMPKESAGRDAVAFESAEDEAGRVYAVHADLSDQAQTVYSPLIRTTVRNMENGHRIAFAGESAALADRVFVSNLAPDTEYRLEARAIRNSTGNEPDEPVRAWTVFRTDGGQIVITGQSAQGEDKDYEDDGNEEETGEDDETGDDPSDKEETEIPEDGENGEDGEDPGEEDEQREDSAAITTESGTQENGRISGYVDVQIPSFNAEGYQGESLVFFETLYEVKEDGGTELTAFHENPDDEEETVHFPDGHTVLTDDKTGTHISLKEEWMDWTDTYSYRNLLPDVRYEIRAVLRCRETGELMKTETDGSEEEYTSAVFFMPDEPDGTVLVPFHVNGNTAAGKTWVAEESLYCGEILVHVHADLADEAQTVYVPEIRTIASDAATGNHKGMLSDRMVLRDEVLCRGLPPGCTYELSGTVMLKEENGLVRPVLDDGGEPLCAVLRFTSDSGKADNEKEEKSEEAELTTVTLDFPAFNAERYDGKTAVIYERLYYVDEEREEMILAGLHEDPENEDQFVTIPVKPPVPKPEKPEQTVITPAPEAVTPSPVRKQDRKTAKSVKTSDESGVEKYLLLLVLALVIGASAFTLLKVRIYLFKKRQ